MIKIHNPSQIDIKSLNKIGDDSILDLALQSFKLSGQSIQENAVLHVIIQNAGGLLLMHYQNEILSSMHWALYYGPGVPDAEKKLIASSSHAVHYDFQVKRGINSYAHQLNSDIPLLQQLSEVFHANIHATHLSTILCNKLESVVSKLEYDIKLVQRQEGIKYVIDNSLKEAHPELLFQNRYAGAYSLSYLESNQEFLIYPRIIVGKVVSLAALDIVPNTIPGHSAESTTTTSIIQNEIDHLEKFLEHTIYKAVYELFGI